MALVTALVLAPASMADWGLKVATHGRVRLADASGSIWHGQGKVVLAAIMLKLGAYAFLRLSLPIAPDASHELAWLMIT